MPLSAAAAERELSAFLAGRTREGTLRRYALTRVRHVWRRIGMIAVCYLAFAVVAPIGIASLVAAGLLLSEAVDCLALRWLARSRPSGNSLIRARVLSTATAVLQALCVAASIGILMLQVGDSAHVLALAALLAGILDAALHYGMHRTASLARIGVYLVALVGVLFPGVLPGIVVSHFLDSAAAVLLLYIVASFALRSHLYRERAEVRQEEMLRSACELGRINTLLAEERERARELAMVAEQVNDAIILTQPDGTISWVNRGFTDTMGYSAEEVIGKHVTILNGPDSDPDAVERLINARREARSARAEIIGRRKDGASIWIDASLTPLFSADGKMRKVIGVERDITEAKARELALAEARQVAEASVRARHVFLATMSHEIRTPMNGVLGTAELLLESPLTPSQRSLVETIANSGDALLNIVNDILDFSRLESGRMTVAREPFDLMPTVKGALDLVRPMAEAKGLSLHADLGDEHLQRLLGDSGRLRQVVLNLLGNAIKFTLAGQVRLVVDAQPRPDNVRVRLSVHDTGIGIEQDHLERIFESFAQADESVAGRFGGTGLGLSISRRLTEAMGGTLTAASEPGRGSVFTIRLDLPRASLADVSSARQSSRPSADCGLELDGRKILVADDNRTNLLLIEKMLAPLGVRLVLAMNGQEAVEYFLRHSPELVLMDVRMPILDGLEATRRIRAVEELTGVLPCPIIALTANAFTEDRQLCEAAGMSDFLSKPYRKSGLLDVIHRNLPHQGGVVTEPDGAAAQVGAPVVLSSDQSPVSIGKRLG